MRQHPSPVMEAHPGATWRPDRGFAAFVSAALVPSASRGPAPLPNAVGQEMGAVLALQRRPAASATTAAPAATTSRSSTKPLRVCPMRAIARLRAVNVR